MTNFKVIYLNKIIQYLTLNEAGKILLPAMNIVFYLKEKESYNKNPKEQGRNLVIICDIVPNFNV